MFRKTEEKCFTLHPEAHPYYEKVLAKRKLSEENDEMKIEQLEEGLTFFISSNNFFNYYLEIKD